MEIKEIAYQIVKMFKMPKLLLLKKRLGKCGKDVTIMLPCRMSTPENVYMSDYTLIQPNSTFVMNKGKVFVGKWSAIASNATILTDSHVPTVGINHRMLGKYHINDMPKDIIIEEDCWIGAGVTLMSGAKVGRGSIAAAGCLVNKNIPPYAVVAGVPARIIASVFTKEQIIEHEKYLYPLEERMSETELNELFEKYFEGKKAIGKQGMSEYDYEQAEKYKHMQFDVPKKKNL